MPPPRAGPARARRRLLRHFRAQRPAARRLAPRDDLRRRHRAARRRRHAREPDPPRAPLRPHRAPGAHLGGAPGARGLAGGARHGRRSEYRLSAGAERFRRPRRASTAAPPPLGRALDAAAAAGRRPPSSSRSAKRCAGSGSGSCRRTSSPTRRDRGAVARVAARAPGRRRPALLLSSRAAEAGRRARARCARLGPGGTRARATGASCSASPRSRPRWAGRRTDAGGRVPGAHAPHPRVPQDPPAGPAAAGEAAAAGLGRYDAPTNSRAGIYAAGVRARPRPTSRRAPGGCTRRCQRPPPPRLARFGGLGALRRPPPQRGRDSITRFAFPAERSSAPGGSTATPRRDRPPAP